MALLFLPLFQSLPPRQATLFSPLFILLNVSLCCLPSTAHPPQGPFNLHICQCLYIHLSYISSLYLGVIFFQKVRVEKQLNSYSQNRVNLCSDNNIFPTSRSGCVLGCPQNHDMDMWVDNCRCNILTILACSPLVTSL